MVEIPKALRNQYYRDYVLYRSTGKSLEESARRASQAVAAAMGRRPNSEPRRATRTDKD